MIIFSKTRLDTALNPRHCLLLPELCDHGVFLQGPISEMDLHRIQNSGNRELQKLSCFISSDLNKMHQLSGHGNGILCWRQVCHWQRSTCKCNIRTEVTGGDPFGFKVISSRIFEISSIAVSYTFVITQQYLFLHRKNAQCPFKVLLEPQSHTLDFESCMHIQQHSHIAKKRAKKLSNTDKFQQFNLPKCPIQQNRMDKL